MSIENLLCTRRVLFINSIRSDIPSGGNTSTQVYIDIIKDICVFKILSLNPKYFGAPKNLSYWVYIFGSMPAAILVLLARKTRIVWLEFFLRLSPIYFIICIWTRLRFKPEFIIFNHHSSFLYSFAFLGCKKIFIWHDLPCLKEDETRVPSVAKRRTASIERLFIKNSDYNLTFSFADQKMLKRLHGRNAYVIPVIPNKIRTRNFDVNYRKLLLIGNWTRIENSEGATALLLSHANIFFESNPVAFKIHFHIAGFGSVEYLKDLELHYPYLKLLQIRTTSCYIDICQFDDGVLLAPVLRGAGIKIKTIEAWSRGIPVIGTRQAFTGIPKSIWMLGGLLVDSPEDMARFCIHTDELKFACENLNPYAAFKNYNDEIIRLSNIADTIN